jgi:hypothetical protein
VSRRHHFPRWTGLCRLPSSFATSKSRGHRENKRDWLPPRSGATPHCENLGAFPHYRLEVPTAPPFQHCPRHDATLVSVCVHFPRRRTSRAPQRAVSLKTAHNCPRRTGRCKSELGQGGTTDIGGGVQRTRLWNLMDQRTLFDGFILAGNGQFSRRIEPIKTPALDHSPRVKWRRSQALRLSLAECGGHIGPSPNP